MTPRLALLAVALAAAGCTRPRHGGVLPSAPTALPRGAAALPTPRAGADAPLPGAAAAATIDPAPHLAIDTPADGARLTSPIRVAGIVDHEDGLLYVAQVVVAGEKPEQRGNARLTLGVDGAFSVDVPYALDRSADGTVEIAAVDPVSGTVSETVRVNVTLAAAR